MNNGKNLKESEELFNDGLSLIKINNYYEAKSKLENALALTPERYSIINNLVFINLKIKNYKEALFYSKKLNEIDPDNFEVKINYIKLLITNNFFCLARKNLKKLNENVTFKKKKQVIYETIGDLYSRICFTRLTILNYLKSYFLNKNYLSLSRVFFNNLYTGISIEKLCNKTLYKYKEEGSLETKNVKKKKQLILGFISADFRNHPVGYFSLSFLKELRKFYKIFLYHNSDIKDDYTDRFIFQTSDGFNFVKNLNDENLINQIKNDNIDILVDLSGHTPGNRLSIFKKGVVPLQFTCLGYLATTGLKEINHIILDPYVYNSEEFFSEKPMLMNKIWCSMTIPDLSRLEINKKLPCENKGFFTFGCLNNIRKLNFNVIRVWSQILKKSQKYKLYLQNPDLDIPLVRRFLINEFKKNGVNREQLFFAKSEERYKALNQYNNIDLALDPFPYNGGTSNFEASLMGVPILVLEGNSFLSRCGVSINNNLNLTQLIAKNEIDYIEKAIKFSENITEFSQIKKDHHYKAVNSPLFDNTSFANDFAGKIQLMYNKL